MLVSAAFPQRWGHRGRTEEGSGPVSVSGASSSACPHRGHGGHQDHGPRGWLVVMQTHSHTAAFAGLHKAVCNYCKQLWDF